MHFEYWRFQWTVFLNQKKRTSQLFLKKPQMKILLLLLQIVLCCQHYLFVSWEATSVGWLLLPSWLVAIVAMCWYLERGGGRLHRTYEQRPAGAHTGAGAEAETRSEWVSEWVGVRSGQIGRVWAGAGPMDQECFGRNSLGSSLTSFHFVSDDEWWLCYPRTHENW